MAGTTEGAAAGAVGVVAGPADAVAGAAAGATAGAAAGDEAGLGRCTAARDASASCGTALTGVLSPFRVRVVQPGHTHPLTTGAASGIDTHALW